MAMCGVHLRDLTTDDRIPNPRLPIQGGFWSDQSGASTVAEELHSSSERFTRVEADKNNSSNELYDRLYRVLEKLSRRRPAHGAPDISCSPNQSTPIAYNKLMKAFAQVGELDEVLRLAQEMKESNCCPNVYCYNTVMNALVEAKRPAEAEVLFKEMVANGVTPTVSSYNILVKLYSFCLKKFNLGYEWMQSSRFQQRETLLLSRKESSFFLRAAAVAATTTEAMAAGRITYTLLLMLALTAVLFSPSRASIAGDMVVGWIPGHSACSGTIAECLGLEEFDLATESSRRILATSHYISYDALKRGSVPCSHRGASYYNCRAGAQANPYTRGCSHITRCRS
ncbi:hypothetical protein HPP92_016702 [Vanilla planifolia]|uniref:Protein RALF-like 33 n=1 Tax=Vanilla planifolia TaxID=51239 RepID=A0A835QJQ3_VANPL|nr:hypothetical protein HPP92_016702 [Vanilla planifolia]